MEISIQAKMELGFLLFKFYLKNRVYLNEALEIKNGFTFKSNSTYFEVQFFF